MELKIKFLTLQTFNRLKFTQNVDDDARFSDADLVFGEAGVISGIFEAENGNVEALVAFADLGAVGGVKDHTILKLPGHTWGGVSRGVTEDRDTRAEGSRGSLLSGSDGRLRGRPDIEANVDFAVTGIILGLASPEAFVPGFGAQNFQSLSVVDESEFGIFCNIHNLVVLQPVNSWQRISRDRAVERERPTLNDVSIRGISSIINRRFR